MVFQAPLYMNMALGFPAAAAANLGTQSVLAGIAQEGTQDLGETGTQDLLLDQGGLTDTASYLLAQQPELRTDAGALALVAPENVVLPPRPTPGGRELPRSYGRLPAFFSMVVLLGVMICGGCSRSETESIQDTRAPIAALPPTLDHAGTVAESFRAFFPDEPLPSDGLSAPTPGQEPWLDISTLSGNNYDIFMNVLQTEHPDLYADWQQSVAPLIAHFRNAGDTDGNPNRVTLSEFQARFGTTPPEGSPQMRDAVRSLRTARRVVREFGHRVADVRMAEGPSMRAVDDRPLSSNEWFLLFCLFCGLTVAGGAFAATRVRRVLRGKEGRIKELDDSKAELNQNLHAVQDLLIQADTAMKTLTTARSTAGGIADLERQLAALQPYITRATALQKEIAMGLQEKGQLQAYQERYVTLQAQLQAARAAVEAEKKKLADARDGLQDDIREEASLRRRVTQIRDDNPGLDAQRDRLKGELLELISDVADRDYLKLQIDLTHQENPNLEQQIRDYKVSLQGLEAAVRQCARLRARIEELNTENPDVLRQVAKLEDQLSSLKAMIERRRDLQVELGYLQRQNPEIARAIELLDEAVIPLRAENETLLEAKELAERTVDELDEQNDALVSLIGDLEARVKELQSEQGTLEFNKAGLESERDDLNGRIAELREKTGSLGREIEQLGIAKQLLTDTTAEQGRQKEALNTQIEALKKERDDLTDELGGLTTAKEGLQTNVDGLNERIEETNRAIAGLEADQTTKTDEKQRLETERDRLRDEAIPALDTAIQENTTAVGELIDTRNARRETLGQKEAEKGRLTGEVGELDRQIEEVQARVTELGTTLNERTGTRDELTRSKEQLITDIGRAEEAIATLTREIEGTEGEAGEKGLEARRNELDDEKRALMLRKAGLDGDVKTLNENLTELGETIQGIEQQIEQKTARRATLSEQKQAATTRNAGLQTELEELGEEIERLAARRGELSEQIERDTETKAGKERENEGLKSQVAEINRAILELRETLRAKRQELEDVEREHQGLLDTHGDVGESIAAVRTTIEGIQAQLAEHARLLAEQVQKAEELADLRAQRSEEELAADIEVLEEQLAEIRGQLETLAGLEGDRDQLRREYPELTQSLRDIQAHITQLLEREKRVLERQEALRKREGDITKKVGEVEGQITDFENQVAERDRLQESLRELREREPDLEQRVAELEAELHRLDQEELPKKRHLTEVIDIIKGEHPNLQDDIATLEGKEREAREEKVRLEAELEKKSQELEALRAEVGDVQARRVAVDADLDNYNALRDEVEELRGRRTRIQADIAEASAAKERISGQVIAAGLSLSEIIGQVGAAEQRLSKIGAERPQVVEQHENLMRAIVVLEDLIRGTDIVQSQLEALQALHPDLVGPILQSIAEEGREISALEILLLVNALQERVGELTQQFSDRARQATALPIPPAVEPYVADISLRNYDGTFGVRVVLKEPYQVQHPDGTFANKYSIEVSSGMFSQPIYDADGREVETLVCLSRDANFVIGLQPPDPKILVGAVPDVMNPPIVSVAATPEMGEYAMTTTQGLGYGKVNEDGVADAHDLRGDLYLLDGDGMGSYGSGDVATQLALESFTQTVAVQADPVAGLHAANTAIYSHFASKPEDQRPGAVAVAGRIRKPNRPEEPHHADFNWLGDTRAMVAERNAQGGWQRVYQTVDEGFGSLMVESGALQAGKDFGQGGDGLTMALQILPHANVVTNALGRNETADIRSTHEGEVPDSSSPTGMRPATEFQNGFPLKQGQMIIFGSDGLWENYGRTTHLLDLIENCQTAEEALRVINRETHERMGVLREARRRIAKGDDVTRLEFKRHRVKLFINRKGRVYDAPTGGNMVDHYKRDNFSCIVYLHNPGAPEAPRDRTDGHEAASVDPSEGVTQPGVAMPQPPAPEETLPILIQRDNHFGLNIPDGVTAIHFRRVKRYGEGAQIERRGSDVYIALDSKAVSRAHGQITLSSTGNYDLADLGSSNGIHIIEAGKDARRLGPSEVEVLAEGTRFAIGDQVFVVEELLNFDEVDAIEIELEPVEDEGQQAQPEPLRFSDVLLDLRDHLELTLPTHWESVTFGRSRDEGTDNTLEDDGRNARVRLHSPGRGISTSHVRLLRRGDGTFTLTDLNATNGTFVTKAGETAERRLQKGETIDLEIGDQFQMGARQIEFVGYLSDVDEVAEETPAEPTSAPRSQNTPQQRLSQIRRRLAILGTARDELLALEEQHSGDAGKLEELRGRRYATVEPEYVALMVEQEILSERNPLVRFNAVDGKEGSGFISVKVRSETFYLFPDQTTWLVESLERGAGLLSDAQQKAVAGLSDGLRRDLVAAKRFDARRSAEAADGARLARVKQKLEQQGLEGLYELLIQARGQRLKDRYEIETLLDVGSQGIVFRAWDHTENRQVVVKQPSFDYRDMSQYEPKRAGDAVSLRTAQNHVRQQFRFPLRQEFEVLNAGRSGGALPEPIERTNGPAIVPVAQRHEILGREQYVVEEYISGPTLTELLAGEWQQLEPAQREQAVYQIARQFVEFWGQLRDAGWHYSDISPNNFIFSLEDGRLRVLDPGSAVRVTENQVQVTGFTRPFTTPSLLTQMDRKKKIHSNLATVLPMFGKLLHYLLTGRMPTEGEYPDFTDAVWRQVSNTSIMTIKAFLGLDTNLRNLPTALQTLQEWGRSLQRDA